MKIIIFAGPSIPREQVEALENTEWRPPVAQGDVYRAAQASPAVIAIIDGYFDGVPSVWHKEILWAMSRGIQVFGASSMGALRAAELHQFGMQGVGEIFEKFRDGIYTDDDEVAVLHGPAELGYLPLNVPMVNVRATLDAAVNSSIIDKPAASILEQTAKAIFYQKRQWRDVLQDAQKAGLAERGLAKFETWLASGQRDVKRADAELLLATLRTLSDAPFARKEVDYSFEWTVAWDGVVSGATGLPAAIDASDFDLDAAIVDQLRLSPKRFREVNIRAQLKQIAVHRAERNLDTVDINKVRELLQKLRNVQGIFSRAQLDTWLAQTQLTEATLQQLLENEIHLNANFAMGDLDNRLLLDELRLQGDYATYCARAEAAKVAQTSRAEKHTLKPPQLLAWFFESVLKESIPDSLDDYLATLGIDNRDKFYALLETQYLMAQG